MPELWAQKELDEVMNRQTEHKDKLFTALNYGKNHPRTIDTVLSFTDTTFTIGDVGLRSWGNSGVTFGYRIKTIGLGMRSRK